MAEIEQHLKDKREELIWALSLQDYTDAMISRIFGMSKVAVRRIINNKPKDWVPKWIKK
jgi:hypothetical protein